MFYLFVIELKPTKTVWEPTFFSSCCLKYTEIKVSLIASEKKPSLFVYFRCIDQIHSTKFHSIISTLVMHARTPHPLAMAPFPPGRPILQVKNHCPWLYCQSSQSLILLLLLLWLLFVLFMKAFALFAKWKEKFQMTKLKFFWWSRNLPCCVQGLSEPSWPSARSSAINHQLTICPWARTVSAPLLRA